MERAPSFLDYSRAPTGRFLVGEHWLAFCQRPTLWGFALWGRVEPEDVPPLIEALRLELLPEVPPHRSIVDTRGMSGADPRGFERFQRYVVENHQRLARQVTRLAIVHPTGFEGAVVAGFYSVLPAPYPVVLATTLEEGLARLEADEPGLAATLGRVVDESAGDPLLGALRAVLRSHPRATLDEAARRVHRSTRTLQRRLGETGTSYSTLQAEVRLAEALARIQESAAPLTSIALDVGFASPQHMSRAVKRATGKTPSELRRR